jgi:hypothetical protein
MVMTYFWWYLVAENISPKIMVTFGGFHRKLDYFLCFRVASKNRVTFNGNDLATENRTPFGGSDFQGLFS